MSNTTTEQLVSRLSLGSDSDHAQIDDNVLAGEYQLSECADMNCQYQLPLPSTIGFVFSFNTVPAKDGNSNVHS